MKNQEVAKIFRKISFYLQMDEDKFRSIAYEKAAFVLENLEDNIEEIYEKGGLKALEKIPGVGESLAKKIEEYIKTGKIKYFEEYQKKYPLNLDELMGIENLGPRKLKVLFEKLKIKNLKDLEEALKKHKIALLSGFKEKTEQNLIESLEFAKKSRKRFLLGEILPKVREIFKELKKMKEIKKISICGSLRRMRETIGDVDFLAVSSQPKKVMNFFISLPDVKKVLSKGITKSSVKTKSGFNIDLRVISQDSFGSALQYFSGSKEHNIALRKIALAKGLKLSEYGLFKGTKKIAGENEKEIYKMLGLKWIEPELRENQGEIEAALKNKLPKIISLKDIKGDLHIHSNWDGGANSIEEIVDYALKLGYEYIGIADHTKFLKIEHGLDESQLRERNKKIDELNKRLKSQGLKIRILKGCESNIMSDGSIDISDDCLAELDFVIAGIHSNFKMSKEEMTERLIKAMKNPYVDIISHPTGRLIQRRDEYEINLEKIFEVARETKTILEINAYPERLDLKDINIKKAKEIGVKMVINTDAHQIDQMKFMEYGVAQARRGWAEKEDIINCLSLEEILTFFERN